MSTGTVYAQTRPSRRARTRRFRQAEPRSFYAATKLAAEFLLGPYAAFFGVIQLRLFMPYGPDQNEQMLFPLVAARSAPASPSTCTARTGSCATRPRSPTWPRPSAGV